MTDKTLFVVIQQGGSSGEFYVNIYATVEDAVDFQKSADEGAYNTSAVVPFVCTEEGGRITLPGEELSDLLQRVAEEAADL